ncbi:hypothetical protein RFI_34099 [Reticulomyxa filosa]|uniref:Transmembrane protein n=1 Tax=Reticulomyxa filosa TaxID=46433 RepID=X6LQ98_RETFI|nr:hypothetical protein RFI_34099 [Reticulomyxa filosa]|eukprot:ETO03312.1 hypothetical protein RFI_34099 [Reticulomyxa filosa]
MKTIPLNKSHSVNEHGLIQSYLVAQMVQTLMKAKNETKSTRVLYLKKRNYNAIFKENIMKNGNKSNERVQFILTLICFNVNIFFLLKHNFFCVIDNVIFFSVNSRTETKLHHRKGLGIFTLFNIKDIIFICLILANQLRIKSFFDVVINDLLKQGQLLNIQQTENDEKKYVIVVGVMV